MNKHHQQLCDTVAFPRTQSTQICITRWLFILQHWPFNGKRKSGVFRCKPLAPDSQKDIGYTAWSLSLFYFYFILLLLLSFSVWRSLSFFLHCFAKWGGHLHSTCQSSRSLIVAFHESIYSLPCRAHRCSHGGLVMMKAHTATAVSF